ncbi:hypothetical protein QOZ80_1BG0053260 [Eleusine coracana subsp. coracana]|nr:hypothetical protein QOZ80_1BG0053260 [Eleusine coracana subsp. coracana]
MAGVVDGCSYPRVHVVSRHLVRASDSTIEPHVLAVSNLDLVPQPAPLSMFCIYANPAAAEFDAIVASFESGLPSMLNHFFPLAGRVATNPISGLPEVHCFNQGAELVVGHATGGVALADLDYGASLPWVQIPCGYNKHVALSVQVVSFACGGFTVAWCTNHMLVDGNALSLLVTTWSRSSSSGTMMLHAAHRPNHDRSVFRPRVPPTYGPELDQAFTRLELGNVGEEESFVERLYYIDAHDIARLREAATRHDKGERATRVQAASAYLWKALARSFAAHARCRMGWVVDGRRRLTAPKKLSRGYVGNACTLVVREAGVEEVLNMPLRDVAAMAREAVAALAYDEHFQELVDWVEEHKAGGQYAEAASQGVGCPALSVTALTGFEIDTDFGFGHAAMAMPKTDARHSSGFLRIAPKPGDDGSWIVGAFVWPRLAAALESDEPCVFKPLTADYLGLVAPKAQHSRL